MLPALRQYLPTASYKSSLRLPSANTRNKSSLGPSLGGSFAAATDREPRSFEEREGDKTGRHPTGALEYQSHRVDDAEGKRVMPFVHVCSARIAEIAFCADNFFARGFEK
jgi:hypothetical protein